MAKRPSRTGLKRDAIKSGFALVAAVLTVGVSQPAAAADAAHPLILELFQSQGCSSCPPAEANTALLADRPDVVVLNFSVTYWDHLGWKDTFAKPEFTQRQILYDRSLHHDSTVFTPQVIVNGRADGVGVDVQKLNALVAEHDRGDGGPAIVARDGFVQVSTAPNARPSDVWLVRYDPRVVHVPIHAGENGGRTLPQRDIVKDLIHLGVWSGATKTWKIEPSADPALRSVVLVQKASGGPILAAARV